MPSRSPIARAISERYGQGRHAPGGLRRRGGNPQRQSQAHCEARHRNRDQPILGRSSHVSPGGCFSSGSSIPEQPVCQVVAGPRGSGRPAELARPGWPVSVLRFRRYGCRGIGASERLGRRRLLAGNLDLDPRHDPGQGGEDRKPGRPDRQDAASDRSGSQRQRQEDVAVL
jgi:hypothetical protein